MKTIYIDEEGNIFQNYKGIKLDLHPLEVKLVVDSTVVPDVGEEADFGELLTELDTVSELASSLLVTQASGTLTDKQQMQVNLFAPSFMVAIENRAYGVAIELANEAKVKHPEISDLADLINTQLNTLI